MTGLAVLTCPQGDGPGRPGDRYCEACGAELVSPQPESDGSDGWPPQRKGRVTAVVAVAAGVLVVVGAAVLVGPLAAGALFGGQDDDVPDEPTGTPVRLPVGQVYAPDPTPASKDGAGQVITYEAANMLDGDLLTAWRTSGPAAGEAITFSFDAPQEVTRLGLVNGYAKTDPVTGEDRYQQGRRIIQVTWTVAGVQKTGTYEVDDSGVQYVELDEPVLAEGVDLYIEEVTPPGDSRFDWTAISEVVLEGNP